MEPTDLCNMSNQERTPEELEALRVAAEAERRVEQARDGLKRIEIARKWLPETIYAWVCEAIRIQMEPGKRFVPHFLESMRLATDERMRSVWELLSLPRVHPNKAQEYFELAVWAPYMWGADTVAISDKRLVEKIADLLGRAGSLLDEAPFKIGEIEANMLKGAACAAYRRQYGKMLPLDQPLLIEIQTGPGRYAEVRFRCGEEPVETLDQKRLIYVTNTVEPFMNLDVPSLADFLREGRDYCHRWIEERRQHLPRKFNQASACRTYVIRQLTTFMRQELAQPYYEYVATTVVVRLRLGEEEAASLDGDFVRKVTANM